jgi:hypothetical protein
MYTVLFYLLKNAIFLKNDHFKKLYLNFIVLSINRSEFDLKMLIHKINKC